jgi:hypothetical protein
MPPDVAARISAALAAERASPVRSTTVVPLRRGTRLWRGVNVAAAAAGVAVVGLVTALVVGRHGSSGAGGQSGDTAASVKAPAASPQSLKQWQTGATYTKATVPALVTGLVLGNPPAASGPGGPLGAAAGPTASTRPGLAQSLDRSSLRSPAAVTACARILNQAPVAPIAVDEGNYGGRPATVIVLPDRLHPERTLDVWVVRTVCSDSAADLAYFTVDRPR